MHHPARIISFMDDNGSSCWNLTTVQARELQLKLSGKVRRTSTISDVRMIAGIDVSASRFSKKGRAAAVVADYPSLKVLEVSCAEGEINFQYIPGLLSFREAPLIQAAWDKLQLRPDLVLIDGQGIAHPRRFGLASHVGILLDIPTIGCAKSKLIGRHAPVPEKASSRVPLIDSGELIGAAIRTRQSAKPLYISIGHRINLDDAVSWVLRCCRGYRLPEPTRLAHLAAAGKLDQGCRIA